MTVAGRALVAGGGGFLGSHLCRTLVRARYRVYCLDNFLTGDRAGIADLVAEAAGAPSDRRQFTVIEEDVNSPPDLRVDYVFHLASPASPVDYARWPLETLLANSQGTLNLLKLARKSGARFLLASTSEVYGDPQVHPQPESYWGNVNSTGPRSCYDEGKRFAEALTVAFRDRYGLDCRIARIFNTYGPGMKAADGRLVPNFITQALRGEPLTVYGDGSQTRSLCYVDDLIRGICLAMFSPQGRGEVFNLGNPEERTVLELARLIIRLSSSSSPVAFRPLPTDDPVRRRPDISKAVKLLGWAPGVPVVEGLERTIRWFEVNLNSPARAQEALTDSLRN